MQLDGKQIKDSSIADSKFVNPKENSANKATDFSTVNNTLFPTVQAVKTAIDAALVGLLDDRGNFDASANLFPATGGSGTAGAILKGDIWFISVAGVLGGTNAPIGSSVRALTDTPGQTAGNWDIIDAQVFVYVPTISNKEMTPSATAGNNQTSGLTITATPGGNSYVEVFVNGAKQTVGNAVKTKDCYFSADGGTTAKATNAIVAGDTLYWNGVIAGWDLAVTDRLDFDYVS